MAKRGEVVDAETAEAIVYWCKSRAFDSHGYLENIRPVIWPKKLAEQALSWRNEPHGWPLPQRYLVHLICLEDYILVVMVTPELIHDKFAGVMCAQYQASYDGTVTHDRPGIIFVSDKSDQDHLQLMMDTFNKDFPQNEARTEVYTINKLLATQDERLHVLAQASAYESFAFSPYTTFKQRPTFRQALSRTPTKREWPAIEIINLRLPEKKEDSDSEGRKLTICFYVKGHLRRQWRPSTKDHKLIWIKEHIRGPKDAPLKPKPTKVYKVTR